MAEVRDPREFFSVHHQAYVESPRHARGRDLDILVDGLTFRSAGSALDVATGGGHTAIKLAERGLAVTIVDITREMLADALQLAASRGITLSSAEAYAESLPFSEETFDIVACRRAAHHFQDIPAFLLEAKRVLKPSGRLGVSDMTGTAAGIDWLNQLERLRDPSHHQALSADAWYQGLVSAGFQHIEIQLLEEPMSFAEWLAPVSADSPDGEQALHFLRSGAPEEFVRDQTFIKRRILLWGER